jgi:archaellum component FlaD/FlaE
VNTVRNENEQISNSVEEVEENVRKLLDIYEMVTRGVNPFADEMDGGMGMGGGQMEGQDGSFGLFTDDEEKEEESVDEDITDADAEGFFDDDLVDDEDGERADDIGGVDGEMDGSDDEAMESTNDSGGTSFEDLKDEYESGEADWDEESDDLDDSREMDDGFEEVSEANAASEFEDLGDEKDDFEEVDDGLADDDLFDETVEEEPVAAATDAQPETTEQTTAAETTPTKTVEPTAGSGESASGSPDGKPYIASLPEGYGSDVILVEWLEFLVTEAGIRETSKAIDYYESVGWISEDVAAEMDEYLSGFQETGRGSLVIDHHKQSLEFINQLNGNVSTTGLKSVGGRQR